MSNTAILHMSDIHTVSTDEIGEELKNRSWLKDNFENYYKLFKNSLINEKEILNLEEFILVISGDLANSSEEEEYDITEKLINELKIDFGINKVLIIPGNHDINWGENRKFFDKNNNDKKHYDYRKEKYSVFSNFYKKIHKNKSFDVDNCIVNILPLDDLKTLIIGINSTFENSFYDGKSKEYVKGCFGSKIKFESNLKNALVDYDEYSKIAVFHHHPDSNNGNEKCGIKDWVYYKKIFNENNIDIFLHGHEHTDGGKKISEVESNYYIAAGSFGKKGVVNSYNLLHITESKIDIHYYHLSEMPNANHLGVGFWNEVTKNVGNLQTIPLKVKSPKVCNNSASILPINVSKIKSSYEQPSVSEDFKKALLREIKELGLYKSGHFHWSKEDKAHNWIDISLLLIKRENLIHAKNLLLERIKNSHLEVDFILGCGVEGNVLSASLSVYLDVNYSYLPYSYQYDDYSPYERKLPNLTIENLLVVVDVMHGGSSIINLIEKEKDFFKNVREINILALFYTGEESYNIDMLKHMDNRIKFHMVFDEIKINSCKCKLEDCTIYNEKLCDIYEFYNLKSSK